MKRSMWQRKKAEGVFSKEDTNFIKGVAILFVILGHLNYLDCAGAWGVHLFLFVSGYGITCSVMKNGTDHFWKKRLNTVYIPYLIYQPICFAILFFAGVKITFLNILFAVVGLDFCQLADKTMWYISYIFAWYLVFWIVGKIQEYFRKQAFYWFWMAIVTVGMAVIGYTNIVWNPGTIAWAYCASFPLGVLIGNLHHKAKCEDTRWLKVVSAIIFICSTVVLITRYGKLHSGVEEFFFAFSGAFISLMLVILFRPAKFKRGGGKVLCIIGKYSYGMYLIEGALLQAVRTLSIQRLAATIIVLFVSFAISVLMWKSIIPIVQYRRR